MENERNHTISIYKQASDYGLYMGLWLSVMFVSMVYAVSTPVLSLLSVGMLIGLPFLLYAMMRRFQKIAGERQPMSALWMLGIMTFIFGGLLLALVAYALLHYAAPNFIYEQVGAALEVYRANPDLADPAMVSQLEKIYDNHMIPSHIQFAMSLLWLSSFLGSLLSLVEAVIATVVYDRSNR